VIIKEIAMNKLRSFIVMGLMAGWCFAMLCACSSDDRTGLDSEEPPVVSPLDAAAETLNRQMAGFDFAELDPLAETIAPATRAGENEASGELEMKLSSLISLLKGDEGKGVTYGRRFSYQAFNTALELAYDLSVILKSQGESSSSWFGLKSEGKGEVSYTARSGQTYRVYAEMEKDISISHWNFDITGASEFHIYKGEELLLTVISNSEKNRPVWLPLLIRGNSFTGELRYRDYIVTLDYKQLHTHERSVVLTYGKKEVQSPLLVMNTTLTDDADILKLIKHDVTVAADFTVSAMDGLFVFDGHTDNINYLVANGLTIAKYMEEGAAEEECQRLIADFNDNLKLSLLLQTEPMGDLFMGVVRDPATGRSYPTVMLRSPLTAGKDMPLTAMLKTLGVDIPDILQTVAQYDN